MPSVRTSQAWVPFAQGRLFAKHWRPAVAADSRAPIVLLHDSLGCVALWRDFPKQLAQATRREVIAYDQQGFGQSDPYPGRLDHHFIEAEAQGAFAALCEQLALPRVIVFGHSVGGAMAAGCAAAHPERCLAVVTESAQAFVEARTLEGVGAAKQAFSEAGQLERLQRYHGDKAAWVLSAWVETWLDEGFRDWNLNASLARVRCPLLALHGDEDEFGSPRQPERYATLTAGPALMRLLPGCGHVPHRERPEAVLEAVVPFLAELAD